MDIEFSTAALACVRHWSVSTYAAHDNLIGPYLQSREASTYKVEIVSRIWAVAFPGWTDIAFDGVNDSGKHCYHVIHIYIYSVRANCIIIMMPLKMNWYCLVWTYRYSEHNADCIIDLNDTMRACYVYSHGMQLYVFAKPILLENIVKIVFQFYRSFTDAIIYG